MTGRPTKLTPEIQERLIEALGMALTHRLACRYAGVGLSTFYRWMQTGERDDSGIYADFRDAIKRAEAVNAAACMTRIVRAADEGHWQAAAWILERRHPEDYGRRVQELRHSGQVDTGPDVTQMAEDIARRIWERRNRPADVE